MAKGINVARMRFRLEFGINESTGKKNPNTGKPIKGFNPHFTKYAGLWSLTQNQQITLAGAGIKNAVVFLYDMIGVLIVYSKFVGVKTFTL